MDPNDVANLNQEAAYEKLREWGYPVTRRMIKYAFDRREMKPVRLGVGNYVSINDLQAWIESRRQEGGRYRLPESVAAQS
jgi:hypothetical protein